MSAVSSNATFLHVEVAESVKGSAPFVNEVQRITIAANGTSTPAGTFAIGVGRNRTAPLAIDVSAPDLILALEQLPGIRGNIDAHSGSGSLSWTVTFVSAGQQALLTSPCEETLDGGLVPDCLLEDASVEVRRVVRGSSPASGTFRLRLVPVDGNTDNANLGDARTTNPLAFDASAEEVQAALVGLPGGRMASVAVAPNARADFGSEWKLTLHDHQASVVELADVHIDGPGPWCADGIAGPAAAETPCEFPFADEDDRDEHFTCAGAVGSSLGWCSTSPKLNESLSWGGCVKCAEGALASPTIHVASIRHSFRLTGAASQVSRALSEVVYHPRALWNAWLGGHDEVSAYWYDENSLESSDRFSGAQSRSLSQVLVTPVNNPPTVTVGQGTRVAQEGEELLLEDADIWDPDLADRPQIPMQVHVEANLGTLALGDPSGLMFVSGSPEPHSSGLLVIKGPLARLRKAMQHVSYRPLKGVAAGATAMRATQEVQRLELTAPLVPMEQSITTSTAGGYLEGNFTLSLNCSVFFEAVDEWFFNADAVANTSIDSHPLIVQSSAFAADIPATGNASMETGIRALLTDCLGLSLNRANVLASALNQTSQENSTSSSAGNFTADMLPYHAATAVVVGSEPDLHGSLIWAVTLIGVPPSFPSFEVSSNNLSDAGAGPEESQYTFDGESALAGKPSVSISVVQETSSLKVPNGSFTLTAVPGGASTTNISTAATGEDLAAALTTLADVGAVQVSTGPLWTSPPAVPTLGRYWEITFLQLGRPIHIGDVPPLQASWIEIEDERAALRVSEVTKGQSPSDSVTVVVNDLGNVGEGEALEASAEWNIAILPQLVAPTVYVNGSASPKDFLRTIEGTTLRLPVVEVFHDVVWETTHENESAKLQYLVRLICARGTAKPAPSVVGRSLAVALPSATVTTLSGSLQDVNRALSRLDYYAPRWYRGVDTMEVVARVAGLGVEGGWGAAKLYTFVDGVNHAPDLTAPRVMRKTGAVESIVGGISVSDDDRGGIMTVTVEAARGLVAFPVPHRLQLLGESEVRR